MGRPSSAACFSPGSRVNSQMKYRNSVPTLDTIIANTRAFSSLARSMHRRRSTAPVPPAARRSCCGSCARARPACTRKNTSMAARATARFSNVCRARLGGNWPRTSITAKKPILTANMPHSTMRTPRLRRQHHPSSAATGTAGNSTKNSAGSTCRGSSSVAETNPAAITAVTSSGLPQAGNVGQFGLGIAALAANALRRRSRRLKLNSASVLVASRRGGDRHRPARNPTSNVRATTESPVRQSAGNRLRADESSWAAADRHRSTPPAPCCRPAGPGPGLPHAGAARSPCR